MKLKELRPEYADRFTTAAASGRLNLDSLVYNMEATIYITAKITFSSIICTYM